MIVGSRESDSRLLLGAAAGALAAIAARRLLVAGLLLKSRRGVRALNAGDYRPLLASFADDAVLRFNDGAHRWSGEYHGKTAIEGFLRSFVAAGLTGEIGELWIAGAPWRMTLVTRFDDEARAPDGERIYSNSTMLFARTRWGKIVFQQDFYEDTVRIGELDRRLTELGIPPASA
jgi:ketosteroid isomerase-like protein